MKLYGKNGSWNGENLVNLQFIGPPCDGEMRILAFVAGYHLYSENKAWTPYNEQQNRIHLRYDRKRIYTAKLPAARQH